jgi:pyruvate dehydrogenase E1 component alpha subunit
MEVLRYIGDGADVADVALPEDLGAPGALEIFRNLVLLRTFDERAVALQRQGRLGTYPMFWGEEATQAGPLHACEDTDWVFPSYRQGAVGILRGLSPATIFNYRRGFGGTHGFWNPRELRVAPSTIAIGTHLPHAVGLGWAAKIRGDGVASLVWFGDGSTSEGDFHEAMNFSTVFRVPTIFFCTNNQWAISTPFSKQSATANVVEKAAAYAMPAVQVDGFDPIACWRATRDALERARAGEGPTLIEALCYRIAPHATADDPSKYRDESVTNKWRALEPVGRTAAYLRRMGLLDDAAEQAAHDDARRLIASAVTESEALTEAPPEILFATTYRSGPVFDPEHGTFAYERSTD